MKKYILSVITIMTVLSAQAQITTISSPNKVNTHVYDSLTNIQANDIDYKYLKGQKLYYIADNGRVKFKKLSNGKESMLNSKDMVGKYFNVVDVRKRDYNHELNDPLILVQDNSTDTICYIGDWNDNKRWMIIGHFEKIKAFYEGKEFVFMEDDPGYGDNDGLINMTTHERNTSIPKGSRWKCKSVSINESINQEGDPFLRIKGSRLVLILENDELGEHFCYYENTASSISSIFNHYFLGKFLSSDNYDRLKKNEIKRKADLILKYGPRRGKIISEGSIEIGMTKDMCTDAWGTPNDINKTTGEFGVHEQWVYGISCYVYFENGVITTIQN